MISNIVVEYAYLNEKKKKNMLIITFYNTLDIIYKLEQIHTNI